MRVIIGILCLFGMCCTALAQDCTAIKGDKERLACFDAASKPTTAATAPADLATPQARQGYADALRRALLSTGNDMSVWAWEQRPKNDIRADTLNKKYPRLIVWGHLNAASVYQIVVSGGVLEAARKRGFTGIEFMSKGPGAWAFDITGTNPRPCDKIANLCL